jgi:hypothetical protein
MIIKGKPEGEGAADAAGDSALDFAGERVGRVNGVPKPLAVRYPADIESAGIVVFDVHTLGGPVGASVVNGVRIMIGNAFTADIILFDLKDARYSGHVGKRRAHLREQMNRNNPRRN